MKSRERTDTTFPKNLSSEQHYCFLKLGAENQFNDPVLAPGALYPTFPHVPYIDN